jgi:hypothetical protein
MLSDIASTIITTFVVSSAATRPSSGSWLRNGGDGMNWSQNSTPAAKKLPCISQMCTAEFDCARSKSAGTCQATITKLNRNTATHGRRKKLPAARSGRDQPSVMTDRVTDRPDRPGSASSSGCHGAPATTSDGAANMSSRCCTMWTVK